MKTKQRNTSTPYSFAGAQFPVTISNDNGSVVNSTVNCPAQSFPSSGLSEAIVYGSGFGKPNYCVHWKHTYEINVSHPVCVFESSARDAVYDYHGAPFWYPWNYETYLAHGGYDWEKKTSPIYQATFDEYDEQKIINDLLELAEKRSANWLLNLSEANQLSGSVKQMVRRAPPTVWQDPKRKLKNAAKGISGTYLAWIFGIKPIINDIGATIEALGRFKRDLIRAKSGESVRVSKVIEGKGSFVPVPIGQGDTRYGYVDSYVKVPQIRYVLTVKPNTPRYHSEILQKIDLLMRKFGGSPATFAWEKVPYSFVIDWFVDLRGVLALADKYLGQSPYTIVSFTKSTSYHYKRQVFCTLIRVNSGSALDQWRMFESETKYYERRLVVPGVFRSRWSGRFGKSQLGTSAALLGQRLKV